MCPKNKPFIFEAFWLNHPNFMEKMKQWCTYSPIRTRNKMYTFQQKLKHIKEEIKKWNRETFGNIITVKKTWNINYNFSNKT